MEGIFERKSDSVNISELGVCWAFQPKSLQLVCKPNPSWQQI